MSANLTISAVDHTTGQLTITAHGQVTGNGPARLFAGASGVIPTGLAALTDYWLFVVDANTVKLADSSAHALSNTPVTFTTNGTLPVSLLIGEPYTRSTTYVGGVSQIKAANLNDRQDAQTQFWNMITGQSRAFFPLIKIDADVLYFETPITTVIQAADAVAINCYSTYDVTVTTCFVGYTFKGSAPSAVNFAVKLPAGAVVTGYDVKLQKTSNATQTITSKLMKIDTTSGAIANADANNAGGATTSANNPGYVTLSPANAPSIPIDSTHTYQVMVFSNAALDDEDTVLGLLLSWKYPHP